MCILGSQALTATLLALDLALREDVRACICQDAAAVLLPSIAGAGAAVLRTRRIQAEQLRE